MFDFCSLSLSLCQHLNLEDGEDGEDRAPGCREQLGLCAPTGIRQSAQLHQTRGISYVLMLCDRDLSSLLRLFAMPEQCITLETADITL